MVALYVVLRLYRFTNIKLKYVKSHIYIINLFQLKQTPMKQQNVIYRGKKNPPYFTV